MRIIHTLHIAECFFCILHLFSLFHLSPSSIFCHFSRVFAYSNASHSSSRLISILMDGFISAHQSCELLPLFDQTRHLKMNSLISSALSLSFCLSFLLSICQRFWLHGFSLDWRRELIRNCQGVTPGKSSDGELALSPGLAVWMVLHIKGNKGKTKTSKKRERNR